MLRNPIKRGMNSGAPEGLAVSLFLTSSTTNLILYGLVGLWCLTPLTTIFQLYRMSVLLVEETGVPGKTTDLSQVTLTNLYVTTLSMIGKNTMLGKKNKANYSDFRILCSILQIIKRIIKKTKRL